VLVALVLAPIRLAVADYNPIASGQTRITLDRGFLQMLSREGIGLSASQGAQRQGRLLTLPVSGGRLDPISGKGKVIQKGTLVLKHGRKTLPLRDLEVKAKRTPLYAKVGGSQLKVAAAGQLKATRLGFGSRLMASSLRLTEKVATRLDKKLGTPDAFHAGQLLGSATTSAQPLTVDILDQGRATFTPDPGFLAKLESLFVSLNPVAPAERSPGPIFTLPILANSALAPDASQGTLRTGGELEFLQLGGGKLLWHELWLDRSTQAGLAEVDFEPSPPYPGKLGQIPILALEQGSVGSDPAARTIAVSGARLLLDAQTAAYFNRAFAEEREVFKAGEAFGSIGFLARSR
jgi:hypothetical protein